MATSSRLRTTLAPPLPPPPPPPEPPRPRRPRLARPSPPPDAPTEADAVCGGRRDSSGHSPTCAPGSGMASGCGGGGGGISGDSALRFRLLKPPPPSCLPLPESALLLSWFASPDGPLPLCSADDAGAPVSPSSPPSPPLSPLPPSPTPRSSSVRSSLMSMPLPLTMLCRRLRTQFSMNLAVLGARPQSLFFHRESCGSETSLNRRHSHACEVFVYLSR